MARVTAKSLQIGAKAGGLSAGPLGLAGEGRDVPGMLRGGMRERGGIRLRRAAGQGRIGAGDIPLGAELPGGQCGQGEADRQGDRHDMAGQQPEDRDAGHG
jgi:hypothetical protein